MVGFTDHRQTINNPNTESEKIDKISITTVGVGASYFFLPLTNGADISDISREQLTFSSTSGPYIYDIILYENN